MKEITIKIKPGGEAFFLYADDAPFKGAGRLDLIRASNVLWSPERQKWVIVMPDGTRMGKPEGYDGRAQAIADEIRLLSIALENGAVDDAIALGFERYDDIVQPESPVLQGLSDGCEHRRLANE